jgi:rSAM/selenodomain-associated transferase 2
MLSVIIPTLNAASALEATLKSLEAPELVGEIIISDGGSTDSTCEAAERLGATVIGGLPGRGTQLITGAAQATQPWLLFLHADTKMDPDWQAEVQAFISRKKDKAGVFKFALNDATSSARRVEKFVAWRCKWFDLPYGDQGLLISRRFYNQIGGFKNLPLFEDVEFVRRIGRDKIHYFTTPAHTSATRYQKNGYLLRPLRNFFCLSLYFAGFSPKFIARLYQ